VQRIRHQLRRPDQRHGHRREEQHEPDPEQHRGQRGAADADLQIDDGEFRLELGEAGDIAAELGEVAEDAVGQGELIRTRRPLATGSPLTDA